MSINLTPWDNLSAFVDPQTGYLTLRAQVYLQTVLEQLNAEFGALEAAQAAEAAAATATAAAATAVAAAASIGSEGALTASGTLGCVITGSDAGASATVSIGAHARVYGGGAAVPVLAGSVTGLDFSTQYWIYYIDPDREGGGVTYQATDDPAAAIQAGDVHSVGSIVTPADGAANTSGIPTPAPGNVS